MLCPDGMKPLFSPTLLHEVHLLLFQTAIMHILITCTSFYLCLLRVSTNLVDRPSCLSRPIFQLTIPTC